MLSRRRDHRVHVLALALGQDQTVEVILKAKLLQFGDEDNDAEQRGDEQRSRFRPADK